MLTAVRVLLIMLDRTPRYGRTYSLHSLSRRLVRYGNGTFRMERSPNWRMRWQWQRKGNWGMSLMHRLNLTHRYWQLMGVEDGDPFDYDEEEKDEHE